MEGMHVAIILDGNRRWAKSRNLNPYFGHKKGAENLENISKEANKRGLKYLTVYIFSTENWKRSKEEVSYLMKLFKAYFRGVTKNAKKNNIKVKFFSSEDGLTEDLKKMKDKVEKETKDNNGMVLNLCFNYGGRREITETAKKLSEKVLNGEIKPEDITEEMFSKNLYSEGIADPDIMIRTSGEQRLSNFLPWQLTYTEFFFIQKAWPDFNIEDLEEIVGQFKNRNRRFGAG